MATPLTLTFDPNIGLGNHKATLSGTVSGDNLSRVDVFSGDTDLGSAQITNGHWTFTQDLGTSFAANSYNIEAFDTQGNHTSLNTNTILYSGIAGAPYDTAVMQGTNFDSIAVKVFKGSNQLYHMSSSTDGVTPHLTMTGDSLKTPFVFLSDGSTSEEITNFHAKGPDHDTLFLPPADFRNMADVLRNTTMVDGSAVIHDPNSSAFITIDGVTKADLRSHPHDIALKGTGNFFGTSAA